jgi:hypothetical protein
MAEPNAVENAATASFAVAHAVPGGGGRGGLRGPVHVVSDGVEDRGDVAAVEGFINLLDGL